MHSCVYYTNNLKKPDKNRIRFFPFFYLVVCMYDVSYNTRKGKNVIRILSHLCPNIPYHLVAICIDLFQPPLTIIRIVLNMASRRISKRQAVAQ